MKIYLGIILASVMALVLSSCGKVYKELHYHVDITGVVEDTVSLSKINIDLHFNENQSVEKQLQKFGMENGETLPLNKMKFTSNKLEQELDSYLRKTFGKNITYDLFVKGDVECGSLIRYEIDKEFKK